MKKLFMSLTFLMFFSSLASANTSKEVSCTVVARDTENRIDANVLTLQKNSQSEFGTVLADYLIFLNRLNEMIVLEVKDSNAASLAGAIMTKEELNDSTSAGLIIVKVTYRTTNRLEFMIVCRLLK